MSQPAAHSNIVGGSTAKRVINCPGSVVLVQKMPPQGSSKYADEGTLLHDTIADVLHHLKEPEDYLGRTYNDQVLTQELIDEKLRVALSLLDEVDPNQEMVYEVETRVGFGDILPGVFGSTDLIGRIGSRAIVLDWKFGDGVAVDADENPQLMFYAAAAMRTPEAMWAFEGATEIECIIIQPPVMRRWVTTPERIAKFEQQLVAAVKTALKPNAPLATGDHCRWCSAKPICPQMNGAIERETQRVVSLLTPEELGACLKRAEDLETYINDLRALAFTVLENNGTVPGYKLVAKRATRQWRDDKKAVEWLKTQGVLSPFKEPEVLSPAAAEKALKKSKVALPDDLVVAVSSGSTLVPESDPRPAALQIGKQLVAALDKLK